MFINDESNYYSMKNNYRIFVVLAVLAIVLSAGCLGSSQTGTSKTAESYYTAGELLFNQQRYKEAITMFDSAIEINPNFKEAWGYKGVCHDQLGEYSEALACYDKVISIDPNDLLAWYNKGLILGGQGRYEEAITCFDKVIAIDPKDAEAWYNKAVALELLGRTAEAQVCYNEAKRLNPNLT